MVEILKHLEKSKCWLLEVKRGAETLKHLEKLRMKSTCWLQEVMKGVGPSLVDFTYPYIG